MFGQLRFRARNIARRAGKSDEQSAEVAEALAHEVFDAGQLGVERVACFTAHVGDDRGLRDVVEFALGGGEFGEQLGLRSDPGGDGGEVGGFALEFFAAAAQRGHATARGAEAGAELAAEFLDGEGDVLGSELPLHDGEHAGFQFLARNAHGILAHAALVMERAAVTHTVACTVRPRTAAADEHEVRSTQPALEQTGKQIALGEGAAAQPGARARARARAHRGETRLHRGPQFVGDNAQMLG